MFSLYSIGPMRGDCTEPYGIRLDKNYTVSEFVEAVLTIKDEWGYIGIKKPKAIFGDPNCEYRRGKLLSVLPDDILNKKVISASADGGWTRMDYLLTIE